MVTQGELGVEDDRSGLCFLYVHARLIPGIWKEDGGEGVEDEFNELHAGGAAGAKISG